MSNEKLKEIRLTKRAKYGFASMFLVASLGIGVASVATRGNADDVVNNQHESVIPQQPSQDEPVVVI